MKIEDLKFIVTDNEGNEKEISEAKLNLWELHDIMDWNNSLPIKIFYNDKELK